MTSHLPPSSDLSPDHHHRPISELPTPRRPLYTTAVVQSQSKPVYPSYHLEQTLLNPSKPRPSDAYKPLNILRSSSRSPQLRLPIISYENQHSSNIDSTSVAGRPVRAMEEFIAVVFGNEVWMGLVDFKSDKSVPPEEIEDEFGTNTSPESLSFHAFVHLPPCPYFRMLFCCPPIAWANGMQFEKRKEVLPFLFRGHLELHMNHHQEFNLQYLKM